LEWQNKGVAPAYEKYKLWAKIEGEGKSHVLHLDNSNNLKWLPEEIVKESYLLGLP
jgi:hypothetical protein